MKSKRPVLLPTVEPVDGEFGRYWVQSSSRPGIRHLVDLKGNRGNGWCGCERWAITYQPLLDRGAKPDRLLACRHIRIAREYSAVELWPLIVRDEEKRNKAIWEATKRERQKIDQETKATEAEGSVGPVSPNSGPWDDRRFIGP